MHYLQTWSFLWLYASLSISFAHASTLETRGLWDDITGDWDDAVTTLSKDFDKTKNLFEEVVANEIAGKLQKHKGILKQFSMNLNEAPPLSSSIKKSKLDSLVTAALYKEDDGYSQPPEFAFAQDNFTGWDNSWFGVALDKFDAIFEVDIDLSGSAEGDFTLSLLTIPVEYDNIGVEVEFQLYLHADASADMSFTTGLELSLNHPAGIMMPALDPIIELHKSQRIGFDTNDFTLTPIFNASMPKLDFNLELALRTVFSVTVEDIDIGSLTLDLPAFEFEVKTLSNKLANCKHPPAGTPQDQIYAELIQLTGTLDATLSYDLLDGEESGVLETWTMWDALEECYAFLPGSGSIGAVPPSSKDSVLSAPAVTTCTSEGRVIAAPLLQRLSTADKVGISIGVVVGVTLILAVAFCAGRASQRRSNKSYRVPLPRALTSEPEQQGWLAAFLRRKKGSDLVDMEIAPAPQMLQYDNNMEAVLAKKDRLVVRSTARSSSSSTISTHDNTNGQSHGSRVIGMEEVSLAPEPHFTEYRGAGLERSEDLGLLYGDRR